MPHFVYVVIGPGCRTVGVASSCEDGYAIIAELVYDDPSLTPYQFSIYETPLDRPMQRMPCPPMPPDYKLPTCDVPPQGRVTYPDEVGLPWDVYW